MAARWWIRPAIRVGAALLLPLAVPAIITALIWALPGDPASLICPPEICSGTDELARRWNLDGGPWQFFTGWLADALGGDFGKSWRMQQGSPVTPMLLTSIPNTAALVGLSFLLLLSGAAGAATRFLPPRTDQVLGGVGLVPVVVMALAAAAAVSLRYGASAFDAEAMRVKILLGAVALGLADSALAGATSGVRSVVESERRRRYVQMGVLRGEGALANAWPNATPAIAGQMRGRALHLLSGAVVVEVVLQIDGLGDLLWSGTLTQDFGVVLAATFGFALLSGALLLAQALVEVAVAVHVRRAPAVAG